MNNIDHGIRAILFDLDGVLVNTNDWHTRAFNLALNYHSYDYLTPKEEKVYAGCNTRQMIENLRESRGLGRGSKDFNLLKESLYKAKSTLVYFYIGKECSPNPEVQATVQYARHNGFKTGVVTNVSRHLAEYTLECAGLNGFDVVITQDEVGDKAKPHPKPYLLARYELGLGPKEALAIDDTGRGIISAVEASCRTWRLKDQGDLNPQSLENVLNYYRIRV